ncbi:MAG: GyrI-like domain-containing protein [Bacteroidales bacterium]|nr:GyrI-like domain-containing protein [Bacteroidales bacterium]
MSYDDHKNTDNKKCKYDACLTIKNEIKPQGKIGVKTVKRGKIAVFTYKRDYKNLGAVYDYIFGKWLINSNNKLKNIPVMEKKLNKFIETNKNN